MTLSTTSPRWPWTQYVALKPPCITRCAPSLARLNHRTLARARTRLNLMQCQPPRLAHTRLWSREALRPQRVLSWPAATVAPLAVMHVAAGARESRL
eukprot:5354309-Pleurochrysis_carterae.AAC.1